MRIFKYRKQSTDYRVQKRIIIVLILFSFTLPVFAKDGLGVVERRGDGKVQLIRYSNGQWQLFVEGRPYMVKGIVYEPVKVGKKLSSSNMWMRYDFNKNGINDAAYESWVDSNKNNRKDKGEQPIGDFKLLGDMGVNTIRIYHPTNINKQLLRDLYNKFGIRVIMGNFLGAYCWGSGVSWKEGTDYRNSAHLLNMTEDVKRMVLEFKDEPYILAWLLGNENDMLGSYDNSTFKNTNAHIYPEDFVKFSNSVAEIIRKLDPHHPVGACIARTGMLKFYKKFAPEIDFIGLNAYRGPHGLDYLFRTVKFDLDKAVLITEYGVDSFNQKKMKEDEDFQVFYHKQNWRSILGNSFGRPGSGNSLGGVIYTWLDSWWLCGSSRRHDIKKGAWRGSAQDGWYNDEWLGVCSQGKGRLSPFLRQLKKVYSFYQKHWRDSNE